MRSLLRPALIITDAVSNSNTVIKAVLETDAGPDDGATDVVHAFGPAERRADDRGAVLKTIAEAYVCADRATVTCAISTPISSTSPQATTGASILYAPPFRVV